MTHTTIYTLKYSQIITSFRIFNYNNRDILFTNELLLHLDVVNEDSHPVNWELNFLFLIIVFYQAFMTIVSIGQHCRVKSF